jgi:hypothetical protein
MKSGKVGNEVLFTLQHSVLDATFRLLFNSKCLTV